MFVAGGSDFLPIVLRRNERGAANRFGDDCADVPLLLEDVLDVIITLKIAVFAAFERTMEIVRWLNMFAAGQQRSYATSEDRFAPNRNRVQ